MAEALVTGATGGIGRAVALALVQAGHRVVGQGRDAAQLAALAADAQITPLALDLADTPAIAAGVAGLAPDVLVLNAGTMPPLGPFAGSDPGWIDRAIAVNLTSVLHLTRALLPGMIARGRGHLIFTGSTAGHQPAANLAVYAATKAGLGQFAQSLRLELSPLGLRVTELVPGRVETGLYRDILPPEARQAMYAGDQALQPEDVAAMVLAVLALPARADVARIDLVPTRPGQPPGAAAKER